jgi:putative copper export protein
MDPAAFPYSLARWVGYLGAFLAVGAIVFRVAVLRGWLRSWPDDEPITELLAARAARLGLLGGTLLLVSAGFRLWFQVRSFIGPDEAVTAEVTRLILAETPWGRGWMAQLGAAVVTMGGFLGAITWPRLGWIGAGIGTTLGVAAAPMTGHAVTEAAGRTGMLLGALHLLAGAAWLGTLTVVLAAGLGPLARLGPAQRGPLTARLITAFSPVALVGALVTVTAGVILSWRYLGHSLADRFGALTGTTWGVALLIKLAVLVAVAGVGAWNWRVVLPRLGTAAAAGRLQRSARAEILLGLILLAVTAVLVALPMPAEAGDQSAMDPSACEALVC